MFAALQIAFKFRQRAADNWGEEDARNARLEFG
jgi:hypothetical protein